jgi:hypothetical protein
MAECRKSCFLLTFDQFQCRTRLDCTPVPIPILLLPVLLQRVNSTSITDKSPLVDVSTRVGLFHELLAVHDIESAQGTVVLKY